MKSKSRSNETSRDQRLHAYSRPNPSTKLNIVSWQFREAKLTSAKTTFAIEQSALNLRVNLSLSFLLTLVGPSLYELFAAAKIKAKRGERDPRNGGESNDFIFTDKLNLSHAKNIVFYLNDSSYLADSKRRRVKSGMTY